MELSKKTVKQIILILVIAALLCWSLFNTERVISLLSIITSVISPLVLGLCIAFVINQLLRPLEKLWCWIWRKHDNKITQKLKRPLCLILSTLLIFGILFAIVFIILPDLRQTFTSLLDMVPSSDKIEVWMADLKEFAAAHDIVIPEISLDTDKIVRAIRDFLHSDNSKLLDTIKNFITTNGTTLVNKTVGFTLSIFSGIINFVLAFAFSMYILATKETLERQCNLTVKALFSKERAEKIIYISKVIDRSFSSFVSGQCVEAVIIGVLCFIGMLIFRFPYASVISVMVGFTALIPVVGAFIGTAVGAFLILMVKPIKALWFIVFIIVLQQFEGNLIYPKVVGKSIGLPGIWVLASITVGGEIGGVVGMLLSVPICSVLYRLSHEYISKRLEERGRLPL